MSTMIEQSIAPTIITLQAIGDIYKDTPHVQVALTSEGERSYVGYDQSERDGQEKQWTKMCWQKVQA